MAKVEFNAITSHFQGKLGDIRFRNYLGRKIVVLRSKPSGAPPTEAQQQVRESFLLAVAYAKGALGSPTTRALYEERARLKQQPLFSVAIGDYFKSPMVNAIDATGYHGHIGDPIKVTATDDFEVVSVDVVIRDAADAVLEQGPAALIAGQWTYATTVGVASGQTVKIEATAKDHPGNPGVKTMPWLIA